MKLFPWLNCSLRRFKMITLRLPFSAIATISRFRFNVNGLSILTKFSSQMFYLVSESSFGGFFDHDDFSYRREWNSATPYELFPWRAYIYISLSVYNIGDADDNEPERKDMKRQSMIYGTTSISLDASSRPSSPEISAANSHLWRCKRMQIQLKSWNTHRAARCEILKSENSAEIEMKIFIPRIRRRLR